MTQLREKIYNDITTNLPSRDKVDGVVTGASEKVREAAAEFGKLINDILDNTIKIYGDDRNIIFSVISTIMDAVNYSVEGGLAGLESELEKIVNEENNNSSGESNAALEFLGDCANFIRFFLEYLYINKKLKINKHLIKKIAEAKAELDKAVAERRRFSASAPLAAEAAAAVVKAREKLNKVLDRQEEASGKASMRTDVGKNPQLKEHNDRIVYLNNAFKHLVFTYGQLSGRTIYNIIKFLQRGGPPEVGWFDPISFGSLTNTMIRASPPGAIAGQVMDSVVDFFKALAGASETSYKSLEEERKLANEYMAYITENTKDQVGGLGKRIDEETFKDYYASVKGKKKDTGMNYTQRIEDLYSNKGHHNTDNRSDTANIEKRIKVVRKALLELNHVSNLKKLLDYIVNYKQSTLRTPGNIYVKSSTFFNTKDNSKIELLTKDEVLEMRVNPKVKKAFDKLIKEYKEQIGTGESDEKRAGTTPVTVAVADMMDVGKVVTPAMTQATDTTPEPQALPLAQAISVTRAMKDGTAETADYSKQKPKKAKEYLEDEYKSLLDELNVIKLQELGDLNEDIHNSGDYGKLAAKFVKLKRMMKAEIQRLVKDVKSEDISIKEQEKLEIVKSGLKKMLEFIRYREFGSINALFKRQKGGDNKTRRGGGDLSNIRRHIAKATRRIETTLNNFNNTRRNKRIKPRKTRRVNYGH